MQTFIYFLEGSNSCIVLSVFFFVTLYTNTKLILRLCQVR